AYNVDSGVLYESFKKMKQELEK
ncbi:hypothetical protein LCGC14_2884120, partial [marine sediment metagenome]